MIKLDKVCFPVSCPEEAIQKILKNLIARGSEGERLAHDTVSKYIEKRIEEPHKLLMQLLSNQ